MASDDELGEHLPQLGSRGQGWVLLQFAAIGLVFGGLDFRGAWTGAAGRATLILGGLLVAAGVALGAVAFLQLGSSLTPNPRPKDDASLVEKGIYSRVRHPIYGGILLACLGMSLLRASFVAVGATALLAAVLTLKSLREEAWLVVRFERYPAYRRRTKRFLPGLL